MTLSHPTRTYPYEDASADRYWAGLSQAELHAAADREPLRFLADHVSSADRRRGCVALMARTCDDHEPAGLVVIPDAPARPGVQECQLVLWRFTEHAVGLAGASIEIGLVFHRNGPASITDVDRRWRAALDSLTSDFGIPVIGVMARLESGALLEIPPS